jgi:hypothetical protein
MSIISTWERVWILIVFMLQASQGFYDFGKNLRIVEHGGMAHPRQFDVVGPFEAGVVERLD